jgi:hypothetical protein
MMRAKGARVGGMTRKLLIVLVGAALVAVLPARASRASDPAVLAIAGVGVPLFLWALFEPEPQQRGPDLLTFKSGMFDLVDQQNTAVDFGAEYRSNLWLWKFKPFIGMDGTTDGSVYTYLGLRLDAYFAKRILLSVNVAPTLYVPGNNGKNLGSNGVLRSSVELGYVFDGGYQMGAYFTHMSHAHFFSSYNPGTEVAGATFSVPIDKIFKK